MSTQGYRHGEGSSALELRASVNPGPRGVMRSMLAGLTYQEQLAAVRPQRPLPPLDRGSAAAHVQMTEDQATNGTDMAAILARLEALEAGNAELSGRLEAVEGENAALTERVSGAELQARIEAAKRRLDSVMRRRREGILTACAHLENVYGIEHHVQSNALASAVGKLVDTGVNTLVNLLTGGASAAVKRVVGFVAQRGLASFHDLLTSDFAGLEYRNLPDFRQSAVLALNDSVDAEADELESAILSCSEPGTTVDEVALAYARALENGEALAQHEEQQTLDLWLNYLRDEATRPNALTIGRPDQEALMQTVGEVRIELAAPWRFDPHGGVVFHINSWDLPDFQGAPGAEERIKERFADRPLGELGVHVRYRVLESLVAGRSCGPGALVATPGHQQLYFERDLSRGVASWSDAARSASPAEHARRGAEVLAAVLGHFSIRDIEEGRARAGR